MWVCLKCEFYTEHNGADAGILVVLDEPLVKIIVRYRGRVFRADAQVEVFCREQPKVRGTLVVDAIAATASR